MHGFSRCILLYKGSLVTLGFQQLLIQWRLLSNYRFTKNLHYKTRLAMISQIFPMV